MGDTTLHSRRGPGAGARPQLGGSPTRTLPVGATHGPGQGDGRAASQTVSRPEPGLGTVLAAWGQVALPERWDLCWSLSCVSLAGLGDPGVWLNTDRCIDVAVDVVFRCD